MPLSESQVVSRVPFQGKRREDDLPSRRLALLIPK